MSLLSGVRGHTVQISENASCQDDPETTSPITQGLDDMGKIEYSPLTKHSLLLSNLPASVLSGRCSKSVVP